MATRKQKALKPCEDTRVDIHARGDALNRKRLDENASTDFNFFVLIFTRAQRRSPRGRRDPASCRRSC